MIPVALSMDLSMWNLLSKFPYEHVLATVGLMSIVYFSFMGLCSVCKGIYSMFLGQMLGHNTDLTKIGGWAVITGATDGIGKAYVEELAKMGIDIVLISRNDVKLKNLAQTIEEEFKVKTKTIAVDFTEGPEIYEKIKEKLKGLDIGILINNVGMSYPYPEIVTEVPNGDKFLIDLINCNCVSCVMMCRIVLPGMNERRKGVVLNVSSGASLLAYPLLSVYAASKIFVDRLSIALTYEYQNSGLIIQSVVPYYVTTKMSKIRESSFFVPTPKEYVQAQLKTIGLEIRTYGYISHRVQGFVSEMSLRLFYFIYSFVIEYFYNNNRALRDAYLMKKQKYLSFQ